MSPTSFTSIFPRATLACSTAAIKSSAGVAANPPRFARVMGVLHALTMTTSSGDLANPDAAPRYDPNEFVADAFAPTWAAMDFTRRFAASTLMIRMTKFRSREGESADGTGRTRGDDDDDDDARTRRVRTWRVKYRWCDYLNTSEIDVGSRVDV